MWSWFRAACAERSNSTRFYIHCLGWVGTTCDTRIPHPAHAPRCLAHEPETGVCESVCGTQTSEPGVAYLSCHGGPRISGTSVKRGIPLLHPSTPHSLRSSASRTTKETVAPRARVARPCQHVTHCLHVTHQFTCSSWSSRVSRAP